MVGSVLLVGAATWLLWSRPGQDPRALTARSSAALAAAVATWHEDAGRDGGCPTPSQLVHEGYLDRDTSLDDEWGGRFRVSCTNGQLAVLSAGPDGREGTGDDVLAVVED